MDDETLVFDGGEIKSLGLSDDGRFARIGGYLAVFGAHDNTDLEGDWFTPNTQFGEAMGNGRPAKIHHGLDLNPRANPETKAALAWTKTKELAPLTVIKDEIGLFAETVCDMADKRDVAIKRLVDIGKLKWSSGADTPRVRRAAGRKPGEITEWPIIEGSLTPIPAQHGGHTLVSALKAFVDEEGELDGEVEEELKASRGWQTQPRDDNGQWTDGAGNLNAGHVSTVLHSEGIHDAGAHLELQEKIKAGVIKTRGEALEHIDALHAAKGTSAATVEHKGLELSGHHIGVVHAVALNHLRNGAGTPSEREQRVMDSVRGFGHDYNTAVIDGDEKEAASSAEHKIGRERALKQHRMETGRGDAPQEMRPASELQRPAALDAVRGGNIAVDGIPHKDAAISSGSQSLGEKKQVVRPVGHVYEYDPYQGRHHRVVDASGNGVLHADSNGRYLPARFKTKAAADNFTQKAQRVHDRLKNPRLQAARKALDDLELEEAEIKAGRTLSSANHARLTQLSNAARSAFDELDAFLGEHNLDAEVKEELKYSANQPRNENGEWSGGGGSHADSHAGLHADVLYRPRAATDAVGKAAVARNVAKAAVNAHEARGHDGTPQGKLEHLREGNRLREKYISAVKDHTNAQKSELADIGRQHEAIGEALKPLPEAGRELPPLKKKDLPTATTDERSAAKELTDHEAKGHDGTPVGYVNFLKKKIELTNAHGAAIRDKNEAQIVHEERYADSAAYRNAHDEKTGKKKSAHKSADELTPDVTAPEEAMASGAKSTEALLADAEMNFLSEWAMAVLD